MWHLTEFMLVNLEQLKKGKRAGFVAIQDQIEDVLQRKETQLTDKPVAMDPETQKANQSFRQHISVHIWEKKDNEFLWKMCAPSDWVVNFFSASS